MDLAFIFYLKLKANGFGFHFLWNLNSEILALTFLWNLKSAILTSSFLKQNPKIQIQSKSDDLPTLGHKIMI